jgi:O-antigen/teichoic acid export membrane protein
MVVIARLLMPADIGLMGIVLFNIAIIESFSQTGFTAALVQQKNKIDGYLDTAQIVSVLRGFILFSIIFIVAPLIGSFFNSPGVTALLRIAGISFLLDGFVNIGIVAFRKELEFNKVFIIQQVEVFVDILVTIVLAVVLKNAWALVFGYISGKGAKCIVSYIMHPYRPRISFDGHKARELFRFGKHLLFSSIIILLITQGDDAIVGKILGATALGFYVMAYKLSNLAATSITHVFSQVAFPVYSKLQNDPDELRKTYLKALKLISFAAFPVCGGLIILAPEVVDLFLGEKWLEIVPAMQILAVFGLIRSLGGTTGPLFQGVGKPEIITKFNFWKLILMAVVIIPLTIHYGIIGTALTVTATSIFAQFFLWLICSRVIQSSYIQLITAIGPSFIITLLMGISLYFIKTVTIPNTLVLQALLIALSPVFYLLYYTVFFRKDLMAVAELIIPKLKRVQATSNGTQ